MTALYPEMDQKVMNGNQIVCMVCCPEGELGLEGDHVVWDCPLHMKLWFHNGALVRAERRGLRQ